MPAESLDVLRAEVARVEDPNLLPLDLTYDSLDRLEDYFLLVLGGTVTADDGLATRMARYLGDTLIKNAGGCWEGAGDERVVARIPRVRKEGFDALGPILEFRRLRIPGAVRDLTVIWDVAQRRRELAAATADPDANLGSLREDIEALTGADPGPLDDGTPAALAALEEALKTLIIQKRTREARRRVHTRAIVYIGALFLRGLGRGGWSVCESPRDIDFGKFHAGDWAPLSAVRRVTPQQPAGLLQKNLETIIEARKAARR
ncbi:hypothetical protein LBMAG42_39590 [Deltaproteobacteria bacterium]|nr:hypothetical protein LBMAG42_39590 [Deltaproteobacteria bacterium]